jgi:hypothetical protein
MKRITLLLLLFATTVATSQSWRPIGDSNTFGDSPLIALDGNDVPYTISQAGDQLIVNRFNGIEWQDLELNSQASGSVFGKDIAIDASGNIYTAFIDAENESKPTVKKFNGTEWEIVGTAGLSVGESQSVNMAIDPEGTPYIAFTDVLQPVVKRFNGTVWETVGTIAALEAPLLITSLEIDSAGIPYLAYADFNGAFLSIMKFNGTEWLPVGTPGFTPETTIPFSIAFNEQDEVYIGLSQWGGEEAHPSVMKFNGTGWDIVGSVLANSTSYGNTIGFDASGNLYSCLLLMDNSSYDLTIKVLNGSTWQTVGEPYHAYLPEFTSMAINTDGDFYVTVHDMNTSVVKLCVRCPRYTELDNTLCGTTIENFNTNLFAANVSGADKYRFRIYNDEDLEQVIENNTRSFRLNQIQPYGYGYYYYVQVAARVNGVWGEYGNSCTIYAPEPPLVGLREEDCGRNVPAFNTQLQADAVQLYEAYRFKVTANGNTQVIERPNYLFKLNMLSGYIYETTYSIEVAVRIDGEWGEYGPVCEVTSPALPVVSLRQQDCGTTVPSFSTQLQANGVSLYEAYRFRVTANGNTQVVEKPNYLFKLNMLPTYRYATTYSVEVAVRVDGQWGIYGPACEITSPALPTVALTENYCGITVPAFSTQLQANGVPLYEAYRFRVTANGNTQVIEKPNYLFKINMIPSYSSSTTYSIEVAVRIDGQWGDYGPACEVSTPGSGMRQNMANDFADATAPARITLSAYPNPFENGFTIALETASEEPVHIMAFDITGKLLEDRTISIEELSGTVLGERFASGVYNVVATQGSFSKSFKMVKK